MIYTVTLNPSIDYIAFIDEMKVGKINRTKKEFFYPGGKGINVSLVLKNLGYESIATGFLAGFVGNDISELLESENINTKFIYCAKGTSRINVKINAKEESEINGMGPYISSDELEEFYSSLDHLKDGDFLVMSGSTPESLPDNIYAEILKRVKDKKIFTVVDSHGQILRDSLEYNPFLVKPNINELADLFCVEIKEKNQVVSYAKKLQDEGARNVLVSMDCNGAILLTENGNVYEDKVPSGNVVNSVGAGDSMVAGFIAGYLSSSDYEEAFYLGLCAGSASAFSDKMATKDEVINLLKQYNKKYNF